MAEPSEQLRSVDVLLVTLDLIEVTLDAPTRNDAALDARAAAAKFDPELARRVAGAAARIGAWDLRGLKTEDAVRRWITRQRIEATWASS